MTRENLKKILREYGVYKYCSDWEALIESLMSEYEEAYSDIRLSINASQSEQYL